MCYSKLNNDRHCKWTKRDRGTGEKMNGFEITHLLTKTADKKDAIIQFYKNYCFKFCLTLPLLIFLTIKYISIYQRFYLYTLSQTHLCSLRINWFVVIVINSVQI